MIINSAPQNEAVLSNVGQIGEFRIRNSAKAFNILSSGLYANKIKAIIRELSCNAVDSHVAAGKPTVPFDVHLPNNLEPHFSIRDYGTGLSHEQVINIYTTYFESTKTDSNAFIGALGLGSKSPFSYTDNFTVTAIKDKSKRIYTAFINDHGVPSIALMTDTPTDEPNGVEVKFSVNSYQDFDKFRQEARGVYQYFKLQPVVSGANDFKVPEIVYADKDIIPGVHSTGNNRTSIAIMGNIAYPIDVPNSKDNLGELGLLLSCGLVIEFSIGEIDFQASREGLSYIPSTINAIKTRLDQLNSQLAVHIAAEADKITNLWERAYFLLKKNNESLWRNAVSKYATDTKFKLFDPSLYSRTATFKLKVDELVSKYNIVIRNFHRSYSHSGFVNGKTETITDLLNGIPGTMSAWPINVNKDATFVVNDTKPGVTERAKYHFKKKMFSGSVYVLEKADKTKDMDTVAFFNAIVNPPESQIIQASTMHEKERAKSMGRNVTILKLESRTRGSWTRTKTMVWADAGKADSFDKNTTHYYVPLSGFTALSKVSDVKVLHEKLDSSGIYAGEIYGVRKGDIEFILTQKNWVNLDVLICDRLSKLNQGDIMGLVKQAIDFKQYFIYNVSDKLNADSPYLKMFNTFKNVKELDSSNKYALEYLCKAYGVANTQNVDPSVLIAKYTAEMKALKKRYPLIEHMYSSSVRHGDIAEYINLIDEKKGI